MPTEDTEIRGRMWCVAECGLGMTRISADGNGCPTVGGRSAGRWSTPTPIAAHQLRGLFSAAVSPGPNIPSSRYHSDRQTADGWSGASTMLLLPSDYEEHLAEYPDKVRAMLQSHIRGAHGQCAECRRCWPCRPYTSAEIAHHLILAPKPAPSPPPAERVPAAAPRSGTNTTETHIRGWHLRVGCHRGRRGQGIGRPLFTPVSGRVPPSLRSPTGPHPHVSHASGIDQVIMNICSGNPTEERSLRNHRYY